MNSKQAEELLLKYKAGAATADEKAWVETWYVRFKDRVSAVSEEQVAADQAESWAVFEKVYAGRIKVIKLWPRVAVAAAAVAAVVFGVWFMNGERGVLKQVQDDVAYKNDIAPGKNTATLTLTNGKVIVLDTNNTSVVVADSVKTMTMLTASTPRGGTYQVVLPDGSHVWLNADSKISFPSQFSGKQRKILLEGEAYFEVATSYTLVRGRRAKQSFIVESAGQEVEVLGTHFNINSYADEGETKTTLIEGSVLVSSLVGEVKQSHLLKPNQQAILANNTIQVKLVDAELETAWKNGMFRFEGTELKTIMQQLGRWYNLDVSYEGDIPKRTFNGVIKRNVNLSEILKVLEAGGVRFKISAPLQAGEANRIIVLK